MRSPCSSTASPGGPSGRSSASTLAKRQKALQNAAGSAMDQSYSVAESCTAAADSPSGCTTSRMKRVTFAEAMTSSLGDQSGCVSLTLQFGSRTPDAGGGTKPGHPDEG